MPTLSEIIRADARRAAGITVDVDTAHETVCIRDDSGEQDDIFMQGDDAREFIAERDRLWNRAGDVSQDEVGAHMAMPYAENLWN